MKLVTNTQMRALDRLAIERYGVPSLQLMERAGEGVAQCVRRSLATPGPVGILLGKGNNAGDGLVAARLLRAMGYRLHLFLTSPPNAFSPDAAHNWARYTSTSHEHGTICEIHELLTSADCATQSDTLRQCVYVIDALLGTGCTKPVEGHLRAVIEWVNTAARPVIAVDIPSGLSADSGTPLGAAIAARITVTLGHPKVGLVVAPGYDYVGQIETIDIGIPPEAEAQISSPYSLTEVADFSGDWPRRTPSSHKGDFGHLLVIAGSIGKMGAGLLAARAALRSGVGLVTYALPARAFEKFDPQFAEVMCLPLPDDDTGTLTPTAVPLLREACRAMTAVAIGPGLGTSAPTTKALAALLASITLPVVVDADALNGITAIPKLLQQRPGPTICTPHPGEMARLMATTVAAVQGDRLGTARRFAADRRVICALKGYRTIVATPAGTAHVNPTGNPGLATAGTGDVLAGVIGALLAQRMSADRAAIAGTYLHGLAGDLAAQTKGTMGLIAGDVIEALPEAIRLIEGIST